jgi:S1-C subfamily serine protease
MPGGPAAAAGLLAGDLILSLDGIPVEGADDLVRLLNATRIGKETVVSILRGGIVETRTLVPVERQVKR